MRKLRYVILSLLLVPGMAIGQQQPGPQTRPAPGQPSRPGQGSHRPPGQGNQRPPNPGHGSHRPIPLPSPVPGKPDRPGQGIRPPVVRPPVGRPKPPPRPNPGHRPQPGKPGYHRPGAGRPPSFRPIRGPVFRYPHGYRYRRWTIGLLLPQIFLTSPYIYSNWSLLGIEPPPPGYYWVRYGPDLLLVRRGTRRIVDVIYGAFN